MRILTFPCLATLAMLSAAAPAARAETFHHCAGFIDTIPAVITTQGVWCLRHDVATSIASGDAILIAANNVTIDCNDYKVGGLSAGPATQTLGIAADGRLGLTVRNCNVRGFLRGVALIGGGGHRVIDNRAEGNTSEGLHVEGDGSVVRGNLVLDTGGSTGVPGVAGIYVVDSVDILDNTVDGVLGPASEHGIGMRSIGSDGGSIAGNRVRGLVPGYPDGMIAISVTGAGAVDVRDNVVAGDGSGYALACSVSAGMRFRGNAIRNFEEIDEDCVDAGGNDIVL